MKFDRRWRIVFFCYNTQTKKFFNEKLERLHSENLNLSCIKTIDENAKNVFDWFFFLLFIELLSQGLYAPQLGAIFKELSCRINMAQLILV